MANDKRDNTLFSITALGQQTLTLKIGLIAKRVSNHLLKLST